MERMNVYLTVGQRDQIKAIANETGLRPSELLRRAIDLFIEIDNQKKKTPDILKAIDQYIQTREQ
jgi:phosphoribosylaminoimidazole (AIR) synthetase